MVTLGFFSTRGSITLGSFSSWVFLENFPGFLRIVGPAPASVPVSSFFPDALRSFFLSPVLINPSSKLCSDVPYTEMKNTEIPQRMKQTKKTPHVTKSILLDFDYFLRVKMFLVWSEIARQIRLSRIGVCLFLACTNSS